MSTMDFDLLLAPFPPENVNWRVGSTNSSKTKALALAYIDARDVMDRLDEVCGAAHWQRKHSVFGEKNYCEVGVKCGDEWVWKGDFADDTDIEGTKGGASDSFKRAAVSWGIGRYLYSLPAVWVTIEPAGRGHRIAASEFPRLRASLPVGTMNDCIKDSSAPISVLSITRIKEAMRLWWSDLKSIKNEDELAGLMEGYKETLKACEIRVPDWHKKAIADYQSVLTAVALK